MSKLYDLYLCKKREDNSKYYLIKSGIFYIFIDEDAKYVSKVTTLKLTNLCDGIVKCGFPQSKLDKYLELFNNLDIDVCVIDKIDNNNNYDKIISKIRNIDINNITPVKALSILAELREMIYE